MIDFTTFYWIVPLSLLFATIIYFGGKYIHTHKLKCPKGARAKPATEFCSDCGGYVIIYDQLNDCCPKCKLMWIPNGVINDC